MKKNIVHLLLLLTAFTSCEPDDICLAETVGTPELILVFYDNLQPDVKKEVPDLQIKGIGMDAIIHSGTTDSISVPLQTLTNSTTFLFTKTENDLPVEETVLVNYQTFDVFISRACGFKTNFKNLTINTSNPSVWIKKTEIISDSISDVNTIHVKILH